MKVSESIVVEGIKYPVVFTGEVKRQQTDEGYLPTCADFYWYEEIYSFAENLIIAQYVEEHEKEIFEKLEAAYAPEENIPHENNPE